MQFIGPEGIMLSYKKKPPFRIDLKYFFSSAPNIKYPSPIFHLNDGFIEYRAREEDVRRWEDLRSCREDRRNENGGIESMA
jgi:hypothetical protein